MARFSSSYSSDTFVNVDANYIKMLLKDNGQNTVRVDPRVYLAYYPRVQKKAYVDETRVLEVRYQNVQDLLARFFLQVHYQQTSYLDWRKYCIGICSIRPAHQDIHIPLLDYDGKGISKAVRADVKKLQADFALGPAHLYRTKGGYHVYFPTDYVPGSTYMNILKASSCCPGFLKATLKNTYGVLRVSAKYTQFDIRKVGVILPADNSQPRRIKTEALMAFEFLARGQECQTHIASLYPQWACFREDTKPWKPKAVPEKPVGKTTMDKLKEGAKNLIASDWHIGYSKPHPHAVVTTYNPVRYGPEPVGPVSTVQQMLATKKQNLKNLYGEPIKTIKTPATEIPVAEESPAEQASPAQQSTAADNPVTTAVNNTVYQVGKWPINNSNDFYVTFEE